MKRLLKKQPRKLLLLKQLQKKALTPLLLALKPLLLAQTLLLLVPKLLLRPLTPLLRLLRLPLTKTYVLDRGPRVAMRKGVVFGRPLFSCLLSSRARGR